MEGICIRGRCSEDWGGCRVFLSTAISFLRAPSKYISKKYQVSLEVLENNEMDFEKCPNAIFRPKNPSHVS